VGYDAIISQTKDDVSHGVGMKLIYAQADGIRCRLLQPDLVIKSEELGKPAAWTNHRDSGRGYCVLVFRGDSGA